MEKLRFLSIRNHYQAMKISPLKKEATEYLARYGDGSAFAEEVYYCMLRALNFTKREGILRRNDSQELRQAFWYGRWREAFSSKKATRWGAKIRKEWEELLSSLLEHAQNPERSKRTDPLINRCFICDCSTGRVDIDRMVSGTLREWNRSW